MGPVRELAVSRCRHWAGLGFGPVSTGADPGPEPSPLLRTRCGASGNLCQANLDQAPRLESHLRIQANRRMTANRWARRLAPAPARRLAVAHRASMRAHQRTTPTQVCSGRVPSLVRPDPSAFPSGGGRLVATLQPDRAVAQHYWERLERPSAGSALHQASQGLNAPWGPRVIAPVRTS